jgi:hypothetical protein
MNLRFQAATTMYRPGQILQQHYRRYGQDHYAYYQVVASTPERVFAQPLQYFNLNRDGTLSHPQRDALNYPTMTPVRTDPSKADGEPVRQWLHELVDSLDIPSIIRRPNDK